MRAEQMALAFARPSALLADRADRPKRGPLVLEHEAQQAGAVVGVAGFDRAEGIENERTFSACHDASLSSNPSGGHTASASPSHGATSLRRMSPTTAAVRTSCGSLLLRARTRPR